MDATLFAIEASAGWVDEESVDVDKAGWAEKSATYTTL